MQVPILDPLVSSDESDSSDYVSLLSIEDRSHNRRERTSRSSAWNRLRIRERHRSVEGHRCDLLSHAFDGLANPKRWAFFFCAIIFTFVWRDRFVFDGYSWAEQYCWRYQYESFTEEEIVLAYMEQCSTVCIHP